MLSSHFTFEKIWNSLQEKQYVEVPFSIGPLVLREAIQAFFRFLEETDEIKTQIDFSISENHHRGDVGFKRRTVEEDIYRDSKEFFHFHPEIFEKYPDFIKKHSVVQNFLEKAQPVWEAAYRTVYQILQTFEERFPKTLHKIFGNTCPHVLLRFLRYHWTESGKYLAKPHFDAGSFTLAIAESEPGLRIGRDPTSLSPVEHKDNHALFFLSSNYRKVIDTEDLAPGWHDVIQTDETQVGKPYARWAIVGFIEAEGVEALSRAETHKFWDAL